MELELHFDAGHGWLKVNMRDVLKVGLTAEMFSEYSYGEVDHMYQCWVYLEQDQDATLFIYAAEARGIRVKVIEISDGAQSPIRNKAHLSGARADHGEQVLKQLMMERENA